MVVGVTWTRGNYTQSARTLSKIFNQERSKAWRNRWFCLQNIPPGSALVASWWSDAARCRNMKMQLSNQFSDVRKYSIIENAIIQSILRCEKNQIIELWRHCGFLYKKQEQRISKTVSLSSLVRELHLQCCNLPHRQRSSALGQSVETVL